MERSAGAKTINEAATSIRSSLAKKHHSIAITEESSNVPTKNNASPRLQMPAKLTSFDSEKVIELPAKK